MDTIKIKTSHTVETEHEIQIPSYYKCNCYAFKIISPEKCVKVYYSAFAKENRGVEIASVSQALSPSLNAQPCTQNEFETIFMEAMVTIGEIAEHGIVLETENN